MLSLRKNNLNSNDGFTILELVIVITIIGILASLSVPSSLGWIYKERQSSYIRELIGYIELVRKEARRWNGTCTVKPTFISTSFGNYSLNVNCKGMDNSNQSNVVVQRPKLTDTVFQEMSNEFTITPKGHISLPTNSPSGVTSIVLVVGGRHSHNPGSFQQPKCILIEAPSGIIRTGTYQTSYRNDQNRVGSSKNPSLRGVFCNVK
mgnify:CR=1 FL=1